MSKKYFDKLVTGSGSTTKKVKSKFGEKIMAQMGWEDGKGLGKNLHGLHEPIQVKRRDLGAGLGQEDEPTDNKAKNFKWNDTFWDDAYNKTASKLTAVGGKKLMEESDSSSSDDDSS